MLKFIFRNLKSIFLFFIGILIFSFGILIYTEIKNYNIRNKTISFNQNLNEISLNLKYLKEAVEIYKETKPGNDFFIYKHNNKTDKVYYYLNLIKNKSGNIISESELINFEVSAKLNEIEDITANLEKKFKLINDNVLKLGNSDNGYTENIIQTENKTDKILKSYPQLYLQFQDLKRLKNELLNSGDKEKAEEFLKMKKRFLESLNLQQSLFENTSEKQIVINNTGDWINTVLQYHKLQKINGTSYYYGLYDEIENSIQTFEDNLFDIQKTVLNKLSQYNNKNLLNFIFFVIAFLIIFILIAYFIYTYVKKQVQEINNNLSEISFILEDETLPEFKKTKYLISGLKNDIEDKIRFIKHLKSNKTAELEADFNQNDKLGTALINLEKYLKEKNEEREKDEELRVITNRQKDGIVKFGKIIRQHFGNLEELTSNLLTELVHFINADIGGIYVIDKKRNPEYLILNASFAYDEKKIINKEIKIGEGLVGTCAVDKSSVYIDRIDDDYIKIVSGFGHTKPKSLLLSPIFAENEIYGVIELASSGVFTEHDIKFIEMLSEDIAYTLAYLLE